MEHDWKSKQKESNEAIEKIPRGSHIYLSNGSATPRKLIEAMTEPLSGMVDTQIIQFMTAGTQSFLKQGSHRFRTNTFFVDGRLYRSVKEGESDYTPVSISQIQQLVEDELIRIDVALIKITPPNEEGMCSLGVGVDMTKAMIKHAKLVIAEVTSYMPWTCGDSLIPSHSVHHWVENEVPLIDLTMYPPDDEVLARIGHNIADQIEDGDTLRIGLGTTTNAVIPYLNDKKHLGLHTEILTDGLLHLIQTGVIDNSQKKFNPGISIVSHCLGSPQLYEAIDNNPQIEVHPLSYTNNWNNIGQNAKMVTISEGYEIDLTGQVCAESHGHEFHGGFGGTADFVRGASLSQGGKSIIALSSTKNNGSESNIVSSLKPGAGVVVTRAEIRHVVTEYGVVSLYGKTVRERCLALIEIAHPQFRNQLLNEAKQYNYISLKQPGHSFKTRYPVEWEEKLTVKRNNSVFIRPVKATDEDYVRDFFHSLSSQSVYLRYFSHLHSLPHQILQGFVDIDYTQNMTLIVINPESKHQEIIGMGQWVADLHDGVPEVAFQVSDEWQNQGLGSYLLKRLIQIAQSYNIPKLKADILAANGSMLHVFSQANVPVTRKNEFGIITMTFDIRSQ